MTDTDEILMIAVRGGDVAKLGILFDRYHRALFDFFVRMTNSRAAADDLVQDVFFRMLKYRQTFRDDSRFRSRVDMARYRFGVGEYKYFAEPLPPIVSALRTHLYRRLAPIANRWVETLGGDFLISGYVDVHRDS